MHQLDVSQADLTLSAEQYRGQLTQAQALLMRRGAEVQEAESRTLLGKALKKWQQAQELFAVGVIAHDRLEAGQVTYAQAKEREISRVTAQKRVLEARLSAAELHWSRMRVLSPLDGSVIVKKAEVGESIERGQPLLVLANPRDLWVMTNIREGEVAAIRSAARCVFG
jgi:multidrug resistance efflux pump